jgi:hypothetical protein
LNNASGSGHKADQERRYRPRKHSTVHSVAALALLVDRIEIATSLRILTFLEDADSHRSVRGLMIVGIAEMHEFCVAHRCESLVTLGVDVSGHRGPLD